MLDPHRLRIFRAVVASGSMRGAAANLGYTPSAVSQHVAALQKETGLRLLVRDGRGVRTTPTGRSLAQAAAGVLTEMAELEATVARLREGHVGALTVRYFASVGAAWMPDVLATMAREFPDLQLDLLLAEQDDGSGGPPDVEVFVFGDQTARLQGEVTSLLDEDFVLAVPDTHPLASMERVPLAELADEPWIDNDPTEGPCRRIVLDACTSVGFSPRFRVQAYDYATALAFVSAGLGVTVLPRLAFATHDHPRSVAVPFDEPAPRRRLGVRVRSALGTNVAVQRMLALLQDQARRSS